MPLQPLSDNGLLLSKIFIDKEGVTAVGNADRFTVVGDTLWNTRNASQNHQRRVIVGRGIAPEWGVISTPRSVEESLRSTKVKARLLYLPGRLVNHTWCGPSRWEERSGAQMSRSSSTTPQEIGIHTIKSRHRVWIPYPSVRPTGHHTSRPSNGVLARGIWSYHTRPVDELRRSILDNCVSQHPVPTYLRPI